MLLHTSIIKLLLSENNTKKTIYLYSKKNHNLNNMAEPQLFPNQPDPQEHVNKHRNDKTDKNSEEVALAGTKLNNVATRLKILEERYSTLRKKSQTTEHNIIEVEKDHFDDLRIINDDISEIRHRMREIMEKVTLLSDEIQNFASDNDLKVIQKYVEFWQPVDFVTRKEVNDFLRRRFHENKITTDKNKELKQDSKENNKTNKENNITN